MPRAFEYGSAASFARSSLARTRSVATPAWQASPCGTATSPALYGIRHTHKMPAILFAGQGQFTSMYSEQFDTGEWEACTTDEVSATGSRLHTIKPQEVLEVPENPSSPSSCTEGCSPRDHGFLSGDIFSLDSGSLPSQANSSLMAQTGRGSTQPTPRPKQTPQPSTTSDHCSKHCQELLHAASPRPSRVQHQHRAVAVSKSHQEQLLPPAPAAQESHAEKALHASHVVGTAPTATVTAPLHNSPPPALGARSTCKSKPLPHAATAAASLAKPITNMPKNMIMSSPESSPPSHPGTPEMLFHSNMHHRQGRRISHTGDKTLMHADHAPPPPAPVSTLSTASTQPRGCAVREVGRRASDLSHIPPTALGASRENVSRSAAMLVPHMRSGMTPVPARCFSPASSPPLSTYSSLAGTSLDSGTDNVLSYLLQEPQTVGWEHVGGLVDEFNALGARDDGCEHACTCTSDTTLQLGVTMGCGCSSVDCTESGTCACGCCVYTGRSPFESAEMARHDMRGVHPSAARRGTQHCSALSSGTLRRSSKWRTSGGVDYAGLKVMFGRIYRDLMVQEGTGRGDEFHMRVMDTHSAQQDEEGGSPGPGHIF